MTLAGGSRGCGGLAPDACGSVGGDAGGSEGDGRDS